MSLSATWQFLPPGLLGPLMQEAISLAEASELFDLALTQPDEWILVPPHLIPALLRMQFLQMPGWPTIH